MTVSAERQAYFDRVAYLIESKRYLELLKLEGEEIHSTAFKRGAFGGYRPTAADIIVTTYPKSGTNWTMQIAQEIAWRGAADYDFIHDVIPWPDSVMKTPVVPLSDTSMAVQSPTGYRVIKSHLEAEFIPFSAETKYIIVVRDPKEVIVSGCHFTNGFFEKMVGSRVPLSGYVDGFLSGDYVFGSWAEHTAGWWAMRDRPNVLILFYHEMKVDGGRAIGQIAEFLGVELTAEQFAKVAEKSSYSYMKANNHKFSPPTPAGYQEQGQIAMVRSGQAGQAGNSLTAGQQAQIDAFCRKELARLKSDFPYPVDRLEDA